MSNLIQKEDVLQVSKRLDIKVNEKIISWVLDLMLNLNTNYS